MADAKFNVLFLHDDQPVRRFRLNSAWIKFVFWFFFLLLAAAVAGIYFSISFWAQFESLEQRRAQLEKLVLEKDVKLERLTSMSNVLREYDELGGRQYLALEEKAKKEARKEASAREAAPPRETETRPSIDLAKLFASIDLKRVALKNISLKPIDNKVFKLSLDIASEDGKPLQGQLGLSAITKDAKEFAIEAKAEDLAFQINKLKPVAANISLTEGIDIGQVFGIKIAVTSAEGKTLFSETFPLKIILARKADE